MYNKFIKNIQFINFFTSISALTFQITLLYPWHKQISYKIDNIEKKYK
jgi:hypothetical protein